MNWNGKTLLCESNARGGENPDPAPWGQGRDDAAPGNHGYATGWVRFFVRLVLAGVSLRGTTRVAELLQEAFEWDVGIPHWTTVRLWLQRLGHARLTMPQVEAEDWAWLIDHSVQIGPEKCLVILGIRLRDLPPQGECLRHENMQLIAEVPGTSWTRQDVDEQLETAVKRTGVPRVIVHDHGGDVAGGVEFFRKRHPKTAEIYDIKHKAACLLKRRLEKNARWQQFQQRVGQTRCAIQQTELGFLTPPGPRPKARFMNLAPLLHWAARVLTILAAPSEKVLKYVTHARLQEKLGWLEEFRQEIDEWSDWQHVVDTAVKYVNEQGLFLGVLKGLRQALPRQHRFNSTRELTDELQAFVALESAKAKKGERLPGSTEILESCFGKFKVLEKEQARGGFTGLLLAFGALLTDATHDMVQTAMQHSRTKDVVHWCHEVLGPTLFSKRRIAFQAGATKLE